MPAATVETPRSGVLPRTGLPDLVLFKNQYGKHRLGEIETYPEDDVNRAYAQNCYIITDIITGSPYKMRIGAVQEIKPPKGAFGEKSYMPEYMVITDAWRDHWLSKAIEIDNELKEFGVGSHFTVPVGDGAAHYVVTAMKKTTCTVEWRGFSADNWSDQRLGGGGSFRIKDIAPLCGRYPVPATHRMARRHSPFFKTWAEIEATGLVPKGMVD